MKKFYFVANLEIFLQIWMFLFTNFVYHLHSVMSDIDNKPYAVKVIYFYLVTHELQVDFSSCEWYEKREFN